MTEIAKLGPNFYAVCPQCEHKIPFFFGEKDAFMSEERAFLADTPITVTCPAHGPFDVPTGKFLNARPS
jgi:nitrite reductase/ring-hydroxylating ferredoxin subunit